MYPGASQVTRPRGRASENKRDVMRPQKRDPKYQEDEKISRAGTTAHYFITFRIQFVRTSSFDIRRRKLHS